MPSSHLILCRPLLLLPPIPPSIRVFSNESTLCMRWPKYWSFTQDWSPLDSILKSRDITLPTKVHLVKAMVFPVVMHGCESWTIKKAERQRIDAFELWCWRKLLRVPWTARRSNQSRVLRQRVVGVYRFVCGSELTICSIWAICVYIHTGAHTHTYVFDCSASGLFFFCL